MDGSRAAVVVAVDAGGAADDAVAWASAEAAARDRPLRIVHAVRQPVVADPYGAAVPVDCLPSMLAAGRQVLRDAVARARSVAPEVDVSARVFRGPAVPALLDESRDAWLLVVGRRRVRGLRRLLAGSVSAQVATHAACPVVVVRPFADAPPVRSAPRVVVGVDGTSGCAPAVGFAFRAARSRGIPLVALHAWRPDVPADLEAVSGPPTAAVATAQRTVEQVLADARSVYADVAVHTVLTRSGAAADALVEAAAGAALLVVGSRGRGPVLGAVLGSVSRTVLRRARSPVAVVRTPGGATAGPSAGFRRGLVP